MNKSQLFYLPNMNNDKEHNKLDEQKAQIKAAAEQWVNILFLNLQHNKFNKTKSKATSNSIRSHKNNYAKSTI